MNNLVFHFADAELGEFRWALLDTAAKTSALNWQLGTQAELPVIASKHRDPVIFLLPQQSVYLTQVSLPNKASRQLLSAIEYQVEDQLAQDIESQHFALGNTSENPISIAVVDKTIMDRCQSLARAHGLRLAQVLPELFLCPWNGSGLHMIEGYDGYLVRYGNYQGLKSSAAALPTMLQMLKRDHEFDQPIFYGATDDEIPELEGVELERRPLDTHGLLEGPVIDLQQRDYAPASAWKSVAKTWKWIGILLGAALAVTAVNKAIALQRMEAELGAIKQQQYELMKDYLPANTSANDNLKKLVIDRLKQAQSGESQQGFLQLLVDFTLARSQFSNVEITRISYQNQRLNVDITSEQLKDIEALQLAVSSREGVAAQLENLNIKPDNISARLVVQGEQNG